jgi:ABC-type polysaccharide/polyol phosphate transport system ATPase subunit
MIRVEGVSKKFRLYANPADRLREKIFRRPFHHEYQALSDISFEVGAGETLGIIGQNGAGKSTLLKILSGVLFPDSGVIEVSGKVTGLLELGTGFNPELTGFQNIAMNGTFLRMTRAEIEEKRDAIIEFAELGPFIDEPIKRYSSGMLMRLGFAIAIHANPECFLVDEALSVGDAYFQQKCMRKIQEFKKQGGSIIFVSHDINAVRVLCDTVILLKSGKVVSSGSPKEVVDYYNCLVVERSHTGDTEGVRVDRVDRDGGLHSELTSEAVELVQIRTLNEEGKEVAFIHSEDRVTIEITIRSSILLEDPHIGVHIRNRLGQVIFETNTFCMGLKPFTNIEPSDITVRFSMLCPLLPGDYSISVGVSDKGYGTGQFEKNLFFVHDLHILKVVLNDQSIIFDGIFNMKPDFSVSSVVRRELR